MFLSFISGDSFVAGAAFSNQPPESPRGTIASSQARDYKLYLPLIIKPADPNIEPGRGGGMINQIPGNCDALKNLKVGWFYNWGADDKDNCRTVAKFIPSIWGLVGGTPTLPSYVGKNTPVITYNEPNYRGQAEMTPQQAIDSWPKLEAMGNPLTSPPVSACEDPRDSNCLNRQWLEQFMTLCDQRHCRVDIIALHYYGCDPTSLLNYLDLRAGQFPGKPLWLTEWACLDGNNAQNYMNQVLPGIETRTKAWAWFAVTTENSEFAVFPQLTNRSGSLSPLGAYYSQH